MKQHFLFAHLPTTQKRLLKWAGDISGILKGNINP